MLCCPAVLANAAVARSFSGYFASLINKVRPLVRGSPPRCLALRACCALQSWQVAELDRPAPAAVGLLAPRPALALSLETGL